MGERVRGWLFGLALVVLAAVVLQFMYGPPRYPRFHNYGVVHTSIGTGVVACGGESAGECGSVSAIIFVSCSPQFLVYFNDVAKRTTPDRLVRDLIGKRPPSGNQWVAYCGGPAHAMIQGQPLARLESN